MNNVMVRIDIALNMIRCLFYYRFILGHFGMKSLIISPLKLDGKKRIFIGERVVVEYKSWLAAMPVTKNRKTFRDASTKRIVMV